MINYKYSEDPQKKRRAVPT